MLARELARRSFIWRQLCTFFRCDLLGYIDQMELSMKLFTALILVPTRELCMQVYEILQKLLHRFVWIVPGYLTGGENRSKEKARLRKGISILVATPGRLLDHMKNTTAFSYGNLQWIVFDEADSILELGFGKAIEEILEFLRKKENGSDMELGADEKLAQQKLLLSATLNEKVNRLAQISLEDPVMIGLQDEKIKKKVRFSEKGSLIADSKQPDIENYRLPDGLAQRYVKVPCGSRLTVLLSLIRSFYEADSSHKMVVFFSTCDGVDFHHAVINSFIWSTQPDLLSGKRHPFIRCKTFCLHGNMDHDARRSAFQGFRTEKSALLLCTDVAARGLDFPKVKRIIQYDSPGEATEYVHRVGRTARLGEKGEAILFLQPIEADYLHDLQSHNVDLTEFPLKKTLDNLAIGFLKSPGRATNAVVSLDTHPWILSLQKAIETFVSGEVNIVQLAKSAFCSWVRAYAAHKGELKRIFMVKKLHLGHVARSFGLREQPSLVGRSSQLQAKKRKWDLKRKGTSSKRRRVLKT
ncbi:P-loop containing nucleoside triphosphate hydrolases superfamily protein isoform X2 [Wolffia australiana]